MFFICVFSVFFLDSFQAWFDFSDLGDKGGHERIVAKEEERHVLDMLHKVCLLWLFESSEAV